MTTVNQLLRTKGPDVWSVSPDDTVFTALEMMADKNIGAVLVLDKDRLVGIFSERDYARKVILKGRSSKETKVRELMTERVYHLRPGRSLDDCMRLMTAKHIRHLPVMDKGQILGMITIGDVVKSLISDQARTIHDLETYIAGGYGSL